MHRLSFLGGVQPKTVCSAGSVYLWGWDVRVCVCVCVYLCLCVGVCVGRVAFVRRGCVYPIPVYLTRYLTSSFFYLDSISCQHSGEQNSFALVFPFSLYSAVHKLLLSHFCAAGAFLSEWLSFSFKLVWADLPCNKISTCRTERHAIQHDCNSLKLSGMCCHCLTAHCVIRKLTALQADRLVSSAWCVCIFANIHYAFWHVSACIYACPCVYKAYRAHTVCAWLYGCACATVCLSEWLTDNRPPEDGGMTIAHPSSVIQHSTGAINF